MKSAIFFLALVLLVSAGKVKKNAQKTVNKNSQKKHSDQLLIGPGNCIIMGDFVHECDGSMRQLTWEEKRRLREQREQAQEDFRQHMPDLPPCFPYCKGHDGKRDGQYNLPYTQSCQNGGDHQVDFNYQFSPCFPFCDNKRSAGQGYNLPPCFPFCNRQQRLGAQSKVFTPCRTCTQGLNMNPALMNNL